MELCQSSFLAPSLKSTTKIAALRVAFSSSCGGLQSLAATVGPFGATFVFSCGKKICVEIFFLQNFFLRKINSVGKKILVRKKILAFGRWQVA